MENIDKRTYSDLVIIFQMMSPEMLKRINPKFVNAVLDRASKEYKSEINPCIPLREQKLSKQTEAFLALIYNSYFDSSDNNSEIELKLDQSVSDKVQKIDNFDTDSFVENKNGANVQILDISRERGIKAIFRKFLNWIRGFGKFKK